LRSSTNTYDGTRKDGGKAQLRGSIHQAAEKTSAGQGRVGEDLLSAARVFINVGGRAVLPAAAGIDQVPDLTNTFMLPLDRVPEQLVVIGGGHIGLEIAPMQRRFGAQVTVVEKSRRLIAREDEEVSQAIREILEAESTTRRIGAERIRFAPRGNGVAGRVRRQPRHDQTGRALRRRPAIGRGAARVWQHASSLAAECEINRGERHGSPS
jgi:pyruvate/2-oxoglutarate dehydrogenase complex dihydrolipoamide dehydrogenase (E3) component